MTEDDSSEWPNGGEEVDSPKRGGILCEDYHHDGDQDTEDEGELESADNLGDFFEERGVFDFLSGSTPTHIDSEHVTEKGLADVKRNASKEDGEE